MTMFPGVGDLLKQQSKRWSVRYDQRSGAWNILDLWHDSLASLSPDAEIPVDSPALKVLSADAFNALIEEANRLGVLSRLVGPRPPVSESVDVETPKQDKGYYHYQLCHEALEIIRQITAASSVRSFVEPK